MQSAAAERADRDRRIAQFDGAHLSAGADDVRGIPGFGKPLGHLRRLRIEGTVKCELDQRRVRRQLTLDQFDRHGAVLGAECR